jgi:PAS domain S-box-containing protein
MRRTNEGRAEFNQEYRIRTAKGEVRWIDERNWVRRDKDGKITHYQGMMVDITDRKFMEEDRKKSLYLLMATLESTADGILAVDWNGKVMIFNSKFVEMWGVPDEVMATQDSNQIMASLMKLVKRPELLSIGIKDMNMAPLPHSNQIEFKDGRVFERYLHPQQIWDKVTGMVMSFRDITDLKKAEDKLRLHSAQLEKMVEEKTRQLRDTEKFAAIGETATMVGHDLRNPLQVIVNKLYLARLDIGDSGCADPGCKASMESTVRTLENQVSYMNKIVSDLQDYAKEPKIVPSAAVLEGIINSVLAMIKIPENVKVAVKGDVGMIISVDIDKMTRVLMNLSSNAIQAMPEGGTLTFTAERTKKAALISVSDTGMGISPENLDKIFIPLFTTKAKGMGFGLAIVKRLVEAHGGKISVESRAGKGTSFKIELPLEAF